MTNDDSQQGAVTPPPPGQPEVRADASTPPTLPRWRDDAERYADSNVLIDAHEDDWAWRRKIRANPTTRLAYRITVGVLGTAVVLLGIVLLPAPGPGWLIIFFGLGILASEFEWAQRLLRYAKARVTSWTDWVGQQNWFVRALVGLGCLLVILAALYLVLWISDVPPWLPFGISEWLQSLPGLK